ncbi:MAG: YifB family Mg chelatase-like AAA ATPase [Bacillota bacterium]
MLAVLKSCSLLGIKGFIIRVEVDLNRGLPAFDIVGLPDTAVRESRERVKSAIKNSGYEFPVKRITINLAPADIKKIGPHFDLAIASGILAAQNIIDANKINDYLIVGELSLNGKVQKVKGILPMVLTASKKDLKGVILPAENKLEASLVEDIKIIPITHISELIKFFRNNKEDNIFRIDKSKLLDDKNIRNYKIDFSEIKGQHEAKRAIEIAVAGGHNLIMIGPPGVGKTMLARRIPTIMPHLLKEEQLEVSRIQSILGKINLADGLQTQRPFRTPHHSITAASMVGGGRIPVPGEISLAHKGVLFLDEISEYRRDVLELLRQPLEDKRITISRSTMTVDFPAEFILIASSNPCPCGYYGDPRRECHCTINQVRRYRNKISGPLLDRIDIQLEVPSLSVDELTGYKSGEKSKKIRSRVIAARKIQQFRYKNENFINNSQLSGKELNFYCRLNRNDTLLLKEAIKELGLSARAYDRILRVARTIADLNGIKDIKSDHLAEAIQYRRLEREIN